MRSTAVLAFLANTSFAVGCATAGSDVQSTSERVIDGVPAAEIIPWQARFVVRGETTCSGALIAPNWVLTAGHCVAGEPLTDIDVVLGDRTISNTEPSEQWLGVASVQLFPGWGNDAGVLVDDDLSLVELTESALVGGEVDPIRLADETVLACSATVAGWGSTSYAEPSSDALISAVLAFSPDVQCGEHLKALGEAQLSDRIVCAGGATGSPGACHGDSGAPFVAVIDEPVLVGISVSGGTSCDELSLFARVSKYREWVASTTGL